MTHQDNAHLSIPTTPDVERYTTRNHRRSWNTVNSHHKCVGQHHIARRRAPAKEAQTMAAMAADLVTGRNRKDRSCLTAQVKAKPSGTHTEEDAIDSYQCNHTGYANHSKKREKIRTNREAVCLECACHNHRRHPSAPRASRALQGPRRRCYQCCT